jgi:hypothetical protein
MIPDWPGRLDAFKGQVLGRLRHEASHRKNALSAV